MPFKNQDLGWIRVNFKKEEDKALRDFASKTNLAPVDWYEDLDEETKEAYNKNVLDKTANTYSAIYKFSPEEEQVYRDRFDIDYTAYIKDPIAANELHKKIMEFIQELIGDYRWDEWKTKMNLNEDIDQRKIKSWALFSDSILEKVYQKVTKEEDLDYLWNEMSRKAISDDQQFAIDYFYNYRKMELGLDYNNELIGKMELKKDINELKEAALGFKPDATSRARASVETMMSNLDKTMEYLQGNAFVKTYKEEDAAKIKELTNVASDVIGDLLGLIDSTPDTKAKGMDEIRLKNYKPLGEEMDLDKTWDDTFGDKAQELADKQRNFAMRDKVKVGDILYKDGRKGKVVKVMSDMANVDFGGGDVYGITFRRIKGDQIEESVNEVGFDANDPVLMKARAAAEKKKQKQEPRINPDYKALKNAPKIKALEKQRAQLMRDMEQEAEPEGGPIANRYGRALDKIDAKIAQLKESINEAKILRNGDEYLGYSPSKQIYRVIDSKTGKEVSKTFNAMAQVYGSDWKEKINEGFTKGQKVTYLGHPGEITGVYDKNGREFVSVAYDKGYGRTKASMILASNGDVKPINENIETLLSPEDLKYYRAHRDEIEDILNAEFRSSKLSAKDAVEKHKAMKEGSCGYNTDAKTGKKLNTPGGLEERIKTLVKEFTKQK